MGLLRVLLVSFCFGAISVLFTTTATTTSGLQRDLSSSSSSHRGHVPHPGEGYEVEEATPDNGSPPIPIPAVPPASDASTLDASEPSQFAAVNRKPLQASPLPKAMLKADSSSLSPLPTFNSQPHPQHSILAEGATTSATTPSAADRRWDPKSTLAWELHLLAESLGHQDQHLRRDMYTVQMLDKFADYDKARWEETKSEYKSALDKAKATFQALDAEGKSLQGQVKAAEAARKAAYSKLAATYKKEEALIKSLGPKQHDPKL